MGTYCTFGLITGYFYDYFSVLHPRHKLQYFKKAGWEDAWIKTAWSIVRNEFNQTYAFMDVDSEENPANEVRKTIVFVVFIN